MDVQGEAQALADVRHEPPCIVRAPSGNLIRRRSGFDRSLLVVQVFLFPGRVRSLLDYSWDMVHHRVVPSHFTHISIGAWGGCLRLTIFNALAGFRLDFTGFIHEVPACGQASKRQTRGGFPETRSHLSLHSSASSN